MTEIVVTHEAFLKKFRAACQLWKTAMPHDYRVFVEAIRKDRDLLRNRSGTSHEDGDLAYNGALPNFVVNVLRMSEWQTNFQYGVPCGTGDPMWDIDPKLYRAAMREFLIGKVSHSRSGA